MTNLYLRLNTDPQPLPFAANDETGRLWTDLANNQEGREATGWTVLAPEQPGYDPDTQKPPRWDGNGWVVDDLPPPPEPPEPQPKILGKLEFIGLVQAAGGMTDAQLVAAMKAPELEALWVKYQMASAVERDHPVTTAALGALAALGFIPNGAVAVLDAWPEA